MKNIDRLIPLPVIACLGIAAASFGAGPVSAPPAAEQQVAETYNHMLSVAETLDLDALFGFVAETDRGSLLVNGRLFLTRGDALADARTNFQRLRTIRYKVQECHVTLLSPESALLIATGTSTAETDDGRSIAASFGHSVVFVLRDGSWKVLHSHQSTLRPG